MPSRQNNTSKTESPAPNTLTIGQNMIRLRLSNIYCRACVIINMDKLTPSSSPCYKEILFQLYQVSLLSFVYLLHLYKNVLLYVSEIHINETMIQWWFVNPGSDSPEILLVWTKVWEQISTSGLMDDSAIQKTC